MRRKKKKKKNNIEIIAQKQNKTKQNEDIKGTRLILTLPICFLDLLKRFARIVSLAVIKTYMIMNVKKKIKKKICK